MNRSHWIFAILLAAVALAYAPGLTGPFLFDDAPNLAGLAAVSADPSWYSLLQYVLGGGASTLGRPLSLLTFAAQAPSWDQHPAHFLSVNLLLHLVNGALWYALLVTLQRGGALPPTRWLAPGAAALWLVLPMHAATVLYVVQRMALLATTCFLAGTLIYVQGRLRLPLAPAAGYARMAAGLFVGTVLGALCKENAAVMPLMLLALEASLLRALPRPRGWAIAAGLMLALPAALLLGYLAVIAQEFAAGLASRGFTLGERLLTEARVTFLYLGEALLPNLRGARALYDDVALSRSLMQPWTTAVAITAWAALLVAAWHRRRAAPILLFAVSWYLLGQLVESSVVPLEIAFSHRAYLPLLGVTLALALAADHLAARPPARRLVLGAAAGYLGLLAALLFHATRLWGDPLAQARHWAQHQPASQRALLAHGGALLSRQDLDTTFRLYGAAWARAPEDAVLAVAIYELGCFHPDIEPPPARMHAALRGYPGEEATMAVGIVQGLVARMERGNCPHQDALDTVDLIDTMLANPRFAAKQPALHHARAMLLELAGRRPAALESLERAIKLSPQVPLLQQAVLWSTQLDDTARARRHLDTLETSPAIGARRRWLYRREIAGTRQLIELYESLPGQPPA